MSHRNALFVYFVSGIHKKYKVVFYSGGMKGWQKSYGYYTSVISKEGSGALLRSNDERAFIIATLQDTLSPRLLIGEVPAYKQMASCIDLLAFSIRSDAIRLVFFAIDEFIARRFVESIATRLESYQSERGWSQSGLKPRRGSATTKKLRGPHHALIVTTNLHLLHEDWEYDRYSSIGFYLHDRRGDWMRTWRMAQLYENQALNYRHLLISQVSSGAFAELSTPQPLVS